MPANANTGTTGGIDDPDLQRCFDVLLKALDDYEATHPNWVSENYLHILESSLQSLRHYVESDGEKEVTWESPFVELHYPIEWNWEAWEKGDKNAIFLSSGKITKDKSRDAESATKMLSEILMTHIRILTLQRLTNFVGLEKCGDYYTPIMSDELASEIRTVRGKRKQQALLEEVFRPHAMGAAYIDFDDSDVAPYKKVSRKVTKQLERLHEKIDLPSLTFTGNIDDHPITFSLILQIHPFIVDINAQSAYYPITIGIHLVPAGITDGEQLSALMDEPWAQPWRWAAEDRRTFWTLLFQELDRLRKDLFPQDDAVQEAIISVTAKLKIPITRSHPEETNAVIRKLSDTFMQTGQVLELSCHLGDHASLPPAAAKPQEPIDHAIDSTPDTLSKAWLRGVWQSPCKWWFIVPATAVVLLFAVWVTLPDQTKMQVIDWVTHGAHR